VTSARPPSGGSRRRFDACRKSTPAAGPNQRPATCAERRSRCVAAAGRRAPGEATHQRELESILREDAGSPQMPFRRRLYCMGWDRASVHERRRWPPCGSPL
jgi:hypothetical protein